MTMSYHEVKDKIKEIIQRVADEQDIQINEIHDHDAIVDDLGFSSLDVATLAANFEEDFGVDPFSMGIASITEVRTVEEVSKVYEKAIKLKQFSDN